MQAAKLLWAGLIFFAAMPAAMAQSSTPSLIKQFKDWSAYTYSDDGGKTCYAIAIPKAKSPKDRDHGDVFFFVSARQKDKISAEPSVLVGYPFKSTSTVKVQIDDDVFRLFTQGEGAWANAKDEAPLVSAMKKGRKMTVSGQSERGTKTSYRYSLSGVTAAIDAMVKACK